MLNTTILFKTETGSKYMFSSGQGTLSVAKNGAKDYTLVMVDIVDASISLGRSARLRGEILDSYNDLLITSPVADMFVSVNTIVTDEEE